MESSHENLTRRDAIRRGSSLAAAALVPLAARTVTAEEKSPADTPGSPVVHFEIGCRDVTKTREFFGKLFGWEITSPPAPNVPAMISAAKDGIGGHITSLGHEPQHYVTIYVQVDDIPLHLTRAEALGGKKLVGPIDLPTGSFAWFTDPDGNIIALWKSKSASS